MKLDTEFVKLPLLFDADRLREEIAGFAEDEWLGHATGFSGNTSIPLISLDGEYNDAMVGPMRATPALARCEYVRQIMTWFDEVFSRSRLMRLEPGSDVPSHVDINYHWYNRVRVHIPIATNEDVRFYCNDRHVHMRAGECWIFNSWMEHAVKNRGDSTRVHLVLDMAGSPRFWELVDKGQKPFAQPPSPGSEARVVDYRPGMETRVRTETFNAPLVQAPGELEKLILDLSDDIACANETDRAAAERFRRYTRDFIRAWREVWSEHGMRPGGWPSYDVLRKSVHSAVRKISPKLELASNGADVSDALRYLVLASAINEEFAPQYLDRELVPENLKRTPRQLTRKDESFTAGRNDPCPCGSNVRFKQCHGRIE